MSGFRGNEQIKASGNIEQISKDEYNRRIAEIIKCKNNPTYFANTYFKIINLEKGLQQITLFPKQEEMLNFFVDNDRCICLSSRQSGKSSTYTIFALWYTMFFPEKKILLACNKLDTALEIMGRISLAYEHLPNWLKPGVITLNKGELQFSNLSGIRGVATSSSSARGASCNCLILDELGFCLPNVADSFFTSVYPVISSAKGTKVIVVSTPNGTGNLYYNLWQQALLNERNTTKDKKTLGWRPFRMDWWERPGRDEEWKDLQIASIGEERFRQEFGNEFLSTSFKKLIPDYAIEHFRQKLSDYHNTKFPSTDIIIKGQTTEFIAKMWYDFDPTRTYLASADVADGVGLDSSILDIWDVTDYDRIKQVVSFSSNSISVVDFAFVCHKILSRFYKPIFICESNSIGRSLFDQLVTVYNYDNFVTLDKHGRPGVYSHYTVKSKACLFMQEFLTTNELDVEIHTPDLINEMETFVKKSSISSRSLSYAAINGSHDDHIMSLVWGIFCLSPENVQNYFKTAGTLSTPLGKIFPHYLKPAIDYTENYNVDNENVSVNSASLGEQWADYKSPVDNSVYGKITVNDIQQNSTQKLNYLPDDELQALKNNNVANKQLDNLRKAYKASEEYSLLSYNKEEKEKPFSSLDNFAGFVDIGSSMYDDNLFTEW